MDTLDTRLQQQIERAIEDAHGNDGGRAADGTLDARRRPVMWLEGKWCGMAEPAGQRLREGLLPAPRDIKVSGRPRAAIEEFVAVAHREIGGTQIDRDGTC